MTIVGSIDLISTSGTAVCAVTHFTATTTAADEMKGTLKHLIAHQSICCRESSIVFARKIQSERPHVSQMLRLTPSSSFSARRERRARIIRIKFRNLKCRLSQPDEAHTVNDFRA